MYIHFIKKHAVGIAKGEVRNLQESQALKMINEKYAEEISKEDYDEKKVVMMEEMKDRIEAQNKAAKDKRVEKDEGKLARIKANVKKKIVIADAEEVVEEKEDKFYHTVTEENLKNNPDMVSRNLKIGDEILLDKENGNPVKDMANGNYIGRDGVLGKQKPSSENTSGDGEDTSNSVGNIGARVINYHTLTQEDLDGDESYEQEGLKLGDEVELQEDGDLAIDDDGKLKKKPLEASK